MKPTPERVRLAAVLLALALLAGVLAWAWRSVERLAQHGTAAEQAQQVLTRLVALQLAVTDAESAGRGLALGGPVELTEALRLARDRTRIELETLRPLLADQSAQYVNWVALGPLLDKRLRNLAELPDLRSRNAAAQWADWTAEGWRAQERVRAALAAMQVQGADHLARALQRTADSASQARTALALAVALGLLLAGIGLLQWQRVAAELRHVRAHRLSDKSKARSEAQLLQMLFDTSPLALCLLDAEGRFLRISAACAKLWGWPAETLLGQPFIDKVWPEDRRKTEQALVAAAAGTPQANLRHRWPKADGGLAQLQWAWLATGRDSQLLGVAVDQTDLNHLRHATAKAADALRTGQAEIDTQRAQLDAAGRWQTSFLAALDQALTQPTRRLLERAAQAQHGSLGPVDDVQRRQWAATAEQAKDLQDAVQDALDIGRADAGQLSLRREAFDLWETLIQAAAQARALAERKTLELQVDLADNLGYVRGDAQRVEQALLRVLRSAIDATPEGRVRLQARAPDAGRVLISVTDGRGAAAHDALLAVCSQGPLPAGAATPPGALGLNLAQRLLRLMGGELRVAAFAPAEGRAGSVMLVELPADDLNPG